MAEKMLMLALSPTMETGTIARWAKKEGDAIKSGDVVLEVETDKAVMDYEAIQEGTLLKILAQAGADVAVGSPIAVIGEAGENIEDILRETPQAQSSPVRDEPAESAGSSEDSPTETAVKREDDGDDRVKASPLARRIARQMGVDISGISGTGPGGRIIQRDVEAVADADADAGIEASKQAELSPAGRTVKVSKIQKVSAERLSRSMFTAPHYYLKLSVNMDRLLEARHNLNLHREEKVSLNAFLMKLSGIALERHPIVNSTWNGDTITFHPTADIGLAVAKEDGLITPVVRNCARKGVLEIDSELRDLVDRARKGKLRPEEYTKATFTISNLGSYGIDEFTAIINPPASAILAVGAITNQPVFDNDNGGGCSCEEEDEILVVPMMRLTLSCDHRVIDGARGAMFLGDLKSLLEDPVQGIY